MGGGDNILDAIYEEDNLDDVEMLDVEEGELMEQNPQNVSGESSAAIDSATNQGSQGKNHKRRTKKKKNKRKRSWSGPNVMDIDRFVLDTCRRLKERKSYMIYTAVGCLGVSALSDLIKEVDAIQTCGGQMTADGRRFRTGGGILWNIIKVREPKAYKEIMKKAKEFEKQFKHPNTMQLTEQKKEESSQMMACGFSSGTGDPVADGIKLVAQTQNQEDTSAEGKHASIHDRLRIPVSYDDDLLGDDANDDAA